MSHFSNPYVDPHQERDRAMSDKAEEIAACEDELQHLRADYARLEQYVPEPAAQPVLDARGSKTMGTDEVEQWRQSMRPDPA